jgi:catechol 2,3-dioxygenase-like lactoylglutathione lyase family enzyme
MTPFKQVAIVVRDLDSAVREYTERLGIGPWTAYTLAPPRLRDMVYHGQPAEFSLRHALAFSGDLQFELVQPLNGPSIFADHLAQHGEGLQHIGKYVPDHPAAVDEALRQGWTPLQSARGFGATGDGAFAYFAPTEGFSTVVELISAPAVRIEPDFVYPEPV